MQHRAYKFRIYPTKSQAINLNMTFGHCRFVWNQYFKAFNAYGMGPVQKISSKMLKDQEHFSFLNEVSAGALQYVDINFREFEKQFFNKDRKTQVGRPQFRKKGQRDSYKLSYQKFTLKPEEKLIRLEKIGHVKIKMDRRIPDGVKFVSVTISKNSCNQYFASILVEEDVKVIPTTMRSIGIDLGLTDLLTASSGLVIHNPRWFRKSQAKLKKQQRMLSRKVRGSNRYERQRLRVAKVHLKIKNQREWFLHQVSSWLVTNYDLISMENLNVAGMKRNKHLSKSISDAGWATLISQIEYKSAWYGRTFYKVDRFFASSKTCSHCGEKASFGLEVRDWTCSNCGTHHDRDLNAAVNILQKGLSDLYDLTSAESTEVVTSNRSDEHGRGEAVRPPLDELHPLVATSMKRQATPTGVV